MVQSGPSPGQKSATSHSLAAGLPTVLLDSNLSGGQVAVVPPHASATSQTPAEGRHTVPAFPAACMQAAWMPSHRSVVQGLPSSEHGVPDCNFASTGQVPLAPVHFSSGSHSPAEGRHTVLAFPAACTQAARMPSHRSVVQGLPSSEHGVPDRDFASTGQVPLAPVHVSAGSHSPAEGRQSVPASSNWQVGEQQSPASRLPSSHSSPGSSIPFPHCETQQSTPVVTPGANWHAVAGVTSEGLRTSIRPPVMQLPEGDLAPAWHPVPIPPMSWASGAPVQGMQLKLSCAALKAKHPSTATASSNVIVINFAMSKLLEQTFHPGPQRWWAFDTCPAHVPAQAAMSGNLCGSVSASRVPSAHPLSAAIAGTDMSAARMTRTTKHVVNARRHMAHSGYGDGA